MPWGDIFTALGAVVAGLSALVASHYSRKSIDYASRAENSAHDANRHALYANVLSANTWVDQYKANVRLWADEACEAMSCATHALKDAPERQDQTLLMALQKLSSLIDRGRWFFSNQWDDEYGQQKESAYRGFRQDILDCLVEAYETIEALRSNKDESYVADIRNFQREFVSEVQKVLNPQQREREIKRVNEQFAIDEKLRNIKGVG